MRRWLLLIALGTPFVTAVAVGVLSFVAPRPVNFYGGPGVSVYWNAGYVGVVYLKCPVREKIFGGLPGISATSGMIAKSDFSLPAFWFVSDITVWTRSDTALHGWHVAVGCPGLALLGLPLAVIAGSIGWRGHRRSRRLKLGLCLVCGYDLRNGRAVSGMWHRGEGRPGKSPLVSARRRGSAFSAVPRQGSERRPSSGFYLRVAHCTRRRGRA